MIKLSKPSKMPCKSWSLPVNEDVCKGMLDATGNVKPVCKVCYAKKGFYHMSNTKQVREHNLTFSKSKHWVNTMVDAIYNERYFRWFDSGDVYSNAFLLKLYEVCKATPTTKHWIPTKCRELYRQDTWKMLEELPNVVVRYSSPSIHGLYQDKHRATTVQKIGKSNKDLFYCPSSNQEGKCRNCRACWNDNIKVVAYKIH